MRSATLLLAAAMTLLGADSWPEFRGPTGQGISETKGLPLEWSESQNVRWKVPVAGKGWSSPVIADGKIWLTTATSDGAMAVVSRARQLRLLAFDAATGKQIKDIELFRYTEADSIHAKNSYASPTPIIEGERVYVHFGSHGTACVKTSGEIVWKREIKYNWVHGSGGSPVLYKNLLILSCDGGDIQFVIALDKDSGEVKWKTNRPKPAMMAFSTPLVFTAAGKDQVVSVGGHQAVSYDPATGKEIWLVEYGEGFSNVPRPVFAHGFVYICTGFYKPEILAVRPDGTGNVTKTHIAWRIGRSVPLTPSPIVVGGEIYFVSDNGILTCADAKTGEVYYQERIGGNYSASPLYADGRIYLPNEDGEILVFAPGRQFKQLAKNHVDGQTFASIAVWEKALILRSGTHLYRLEKK